jgi:hypothetical protein
LVVLEQLTVQVVERGVGFPHIDGGQGDGTQDDCDTDRDTDGRDSARDEKTR